MSPQRRRAGEEDYPLRCLNNLSIVVPPPPPPPLLRQYTTFATAPLHQRPTPITRSSVEKIVII